ncbi:hypothetical protein CEUSTIGMA_g8171.t1 [Chlamydomonas eustigma]|uniref:Uncharacterized protein n=1 Tax=Chlamydomonas eustigma TaxID=1157962 RepID=A0A250XCF4_9CHLO|nr:hypothetical protein CEUSTIGMA_g8171.t1 [Chlamydomonas eustigma]|eukprot:GAX80736.1 hypothetical protein CEUSTIGMA_g8171.t1 [Chlamydomonas eustigma]
MMSANRGELEDLSFLVSALTDLLIQSRVPQRIQAACALCRLVQDRMERHLGTENEASLQVAASHTRALKESDSIQSAEQLGRAVLIRREGQDASTLDLMDSLVDLGQICMTLGQGMEDEAEELILRAVGLGQETFGSLTHPWCIPAIHALSLLYQTKGQHGDAAAWLVQTRVAMSKVYNADSNPFILATLQLSMSMEHLEDLATAEKLLRRLVGLAEDAEGGRVLPGPPKASKPVLMFAAPSVGLTLEPPKSPLIGSHSLRSKLEGHRMSSLSPPRTSSLLSGPGRDAGKRSQSRERAGSITQPYHRSSTGPDKGRSPTPRSPSYQDGNGNASPSTLPRSLQGSRNSSPSSPSRYLKDGEKSSPRASPSMGRGGRNSQGESRQLPPELQAARPAFTPPSSAERLLSPRKLQNKLNGLMFTVLCRLASVIVEGVKAQTTKAPAIEATPSASVTSSKWQQNSSKADKGKQRSLENVDLVHPSSSHTHNTRRKSLSGTTGAHAYIQDTALANEVTARIILHPDESGNADGQPAQEDGGGSGEMNPEVPAMIDGGGDGMHPPHHRLPSAKDLQRITRDDYDSSDMEADGVGLLGTEVLQLQSEVVGQPDNLDSLTFSPKRLDSPHAPSSAQLSLAVTVDSLDVGEGRQGAILTGTIFPTMCEENGETILQEESSNRRLRASTSILLRVDKSREIREQIESGMKEEDERTDSLRRGIKPGNSVVGEIDFGRISQLGTQEILPLPGLPTDTPVEGVDVSAVPRGDKQTPFKTQSKTVQRDPQEVFVELAVIVRQLLGMFDEEMRSARAAIVAAEKEKELQKLSKGERTIKKREEMREEQGFYNPNKASKGGFIGSHQKAALGAYPLRGTQRFLDAGGVTNPEQRKFKVRQRDPAAAGQDREGAKSPGANGNKAGQHKSNQMSGGFEGGRRAGGSPGRRTLAQVATKSHRTLLPSLNGHQNKQRSEATSGGHQSAQAEAHAMPWTSLKDALAEAPMSSVAKERRAMLKELELKLKQRGAMLQKQGDENSASSVLQQGLYIMLHLEGPGSDDALSAVATVVDMLVAKRRFAEARMQLNQQLSLPGMTLTNKHLLKTRVQKYMTEAAFKAAEAEDTETCLEALGLGAKPTLDDRNLLVLSASLGNREICQALLSLDPHLVDSYERRSTMTALIAASEGGHGSIVEDLIAVKRSGVDAGDLKGRSGLHYTALRGHQRVTKLLLAARANINIRDGVLRSTPLMLASEAGHLGVVQILLEMGAQADFLDNNSRSSLILACIAQRSDVVSVLLSCRCRLSIQDKDGRTALSYACEQGDLENVSSLILARADLELPNSCNVTPLMLAARGGHARIVDLLLKQSVGSESKDNSGRTALMYGAAEGHVDVCASLISNCMKHSERSEAQARLLDAKLEAETKKQNAMVQSKVDEALARVGVKIVIEPTPPLTPDVDLVEDDEEEEEEEEEDNGKGLSVLEKLSRSRRILPKVRQFVSIFDKFGCSAADLASENGHRELAMLLRNIMMSNLERSSMKLQEMEAVGSQDLEPLPETMS